ncbi:hypothetical protein LK12_07460 [Novosphingobium malaysiense]|uniref:Epoxide hydrolase N-terminal domain-containing protein n=1 Tax=Novosphingobium malaysiense TaxID=1348853 RepID=A0A0B1ZUB1_9SPHN|nr:hypothetical protein LK12_07460 [Novosphingobium malaysiense]
MDFRLESAAVEDLRRRLDATRWLPSAAAQVAGAGASLQFVQDLCGHWRDRFDWPAFEQAIRSRQQVLVPTSGNPIHAMMRSSAHYRAVPLLLLHGWPSAFLEFAGVADRLAEPGDGMPAFHVVVPSLPGYGFSPFAPGLSPRRIATLMLEMMRALGHERFLVQGGNWGSSIATEMARQAPDRLIGLHLNTVNGSAPTADAPALSADDQAIADTYATLLGWPHFNLLAQAPVSIAHALNDSPAGLAAWIGERLHDWSDRAIPDNPARDPEWICRVVSLYWLTGTAASSAMLYREAVQDPAPERYVSVPTAVAHYAAEPVMIPRPWAERHYNVVRWERFGSGGHFPAIEVPGLFVEDLRAFASQLGAGTGTG